MQTFADLADEIPHFKRVQDYRYSHVYSITLTVPDKAPSDTVPIERLAILGIEEDAAFFITHIVGSVIAPVDLTTALPSRFEVQNPAFPMAGAADPAGGIGAPTTSRYDRGIDFGIIDTATGKSLTRASLFSPQCQAFGDWIPFNALLTPGYSFSFASPVPWEFFLERQKYLQFKVRNRGASDDGGDPPASSGAGALVTFAFLGQRMDS
jgi:hypothetical protein